jgi:hypothetical protein
MTSYDTNYNSWNDLSQPLIYCTFPSIKPQEGIFPTQTSNGLLGNLLVMIAVELAHWLPYMSKSMHPIDA